MKEYLLVSEKFYSIQGEGPTVGYPSIFLRLTACNLLCESSSWICDTIEVWKKGLKTSFENIFTEEEVSLLRKGAHLVITGGEPLLQQKNISLFLNWFEAKFNFMPYIEIETNGTIFISVELFEKIKQLNISPKLTNSGETRERRYKENYLKGFNYFEGVKVVFKFVVGNEGDWVEIQQDFSFISKDKIYLMPAGSTQEELEKTRPLVAEICKENLIKFTDRTHISIWNKKTGV